MDSSLFFILGNPRSGTTLLRLMLTSHKSILVPPEAGFIIWLADKYLDKDFSQKKVISDFVRDLVQTRKFETWNLDANKIENYLLIMKPLNYQDAAILVYKLYIKLIGKNAIIIGDKNNFYIKFLPKLKILFPRAKFIFIVRDGRDVVCSYRSVMACRHRSKYAPKLPTSIEEIASEWSENNLELIRNFGRESIIIRYEDLLCNPEASLSSICNHLGLIFDPEMISNYGIMAKIYNPEEFMNWNNKLTSPLDKENIGKYKSVLTTEEIRLFNRIAESELRYFNYL